MREERGKVERKDLKTLFHMEPSTHKEEYARRFQDIDTIHLTVDIAGNESFICQTPGIYKRIVSILRMNHDIGIVSSRLPGVALEQFRQRCLIDEIILTNDIEGVQSTRREISEILQDLSYLIIQVRLRLRMLILKELLLLIHS